SLSSLSTSSQPYFLTSFFLFILLPLPISTLFPYTTLFRSDLEYLVIVPYFLLLKYYLYIIKARIHVYQYLFHSFNVNLKNISNRSEEHTSELQSRFDLVCRLLLEKKKKQQNIQIRLTEVTI